ncbi:MAG: hypothetical protein ACK4V0_05585 [Aphanizomenon sp.]|jgi:hypothetical protein|uniref:Glycosyltransferase n=1 Tax=Aphanizomenon flos-aquae FACHB-1040 TaxID=2692887 RepID=A0ABR8BWM6_APHFL|nr:MULTISPECIES: hypothetical protein [Aphanizomenon]MBD2279339.1 hypothetical protein [Aphanizomenon flos-aquae FACHB-1040]MDB9307534.1 hypothetical protein [Aphanizomenon sp. CS-733/32]
MTIPILVVSCDKYQDVWHPFFHCFFKNWPDCPYPIYLVSNTLEYPDDRVSSILINPDIDYSSNLIKALNQIPQEWVIFWVEDRPPAIPVDTARLVKLIQLAQSKNAGYLKLIPCNPPALVDEAEEIGELPKGSRYRISMTVALWKKETLLKILKAGETAWDIEKRGGLQRANEINDRFYALPIGSFSNPPLLDIHLISKRQLMWRGTKLLKNENIFHYLEDRPKASSWKNIYFECYDLIWNLYYRMIWFYKKIKSHE